MGGAVEIRRRELSAADLRGHASKERDGQIVRLLLAIAMVLEGGRSDMDRQTLADWVHRYNTY